ncbi:MAG: hypothetical protein ACLFQJ_09245 [Campylobacterales bacterium]
MISIHPYLKYKFLNSLFAGLSIGAVFVIYLPLEPIVFSIGGLGLAVFSYIVARLYMRLLNLKSFVRINLFIEVLMFFTIIYFLLSTQDFMSALVVYLAYQIMFGFGGYIYRAETLLLHKKPIIKAPDVAKQKGYIVGMLLSLGYFKLMGTFLDDKFTQVYYIHFFLLVLQVFVLWFLYRAFYSSKSAQKPSVAENFD